MHYDLRLEIDGVLKSWAVPKGPSLDPSARRLAVATEDHPMDYADFEGNIPRGEYGGGAVIVWDRGVYRILRDGKPRRATSALMSAAYEAGRIEVWLEGKKLRGVWVLVETKMRGRAMNWLLIKKKDEFASRTLDPVRDETKSVLSGETVVSMAARDASPGKKRSGQRTSGVK